MTKKKKKIIGYIMMGIYSLVLSSWISGILKQILDITLGGAEKDIFSIGLGYIYNLSQLFHSRQQVYLCLGLEILMMLLLWQFQSGTAPKIGLVRVTDKIYIPEPAGEGQHGKARFLTDAEKDKIYAVVKYDTKKECVIGQKDMNVGLVFGMTKHGTKEKIHALVEDEHAIIIAASRSGKTRTAVLETIWLRSFYKRSMVIPDPKLELYLYTHDYVESKGVETWLLNFRNPEQSIHFNYLHEINRAVDEGNIPRAVEKTWDLTSSLVGEPKGEPLWTNGQAAVIAAAILAVSMMAPEPCRNMTNVYYFIAYMCQADEFGQMPINSFFAELPDNHPAKGIFAVAKISPSKTRGSFFGSALATLRLFTDYGIAEMTSRSDISLENIGKQPVFLYIGIADEKHTLYPLVALLIDQIYIKLVEVANENGGRLPVETDFMLEEFGQMPVIPSLGGKLSVAAGRGMRFYFVIQDYQQMDGKYKDDCKIIKSNCLNTLYLKSASLDTNKEISQSLDTYTCKSTNAGTSTSGTIGSMNYNASGGSSLMSRALLTPGEVGMIERPYSLVRHTGDYPGIMTCPDLSGYHANKELGLGDKKHNQKVMLEREKKIPKHEIKEPELWGIWNEYCEYQADDIPQSETGQEEEHQTAQETQNGVTFLI